MFYVIAQFTCIIVLIINSDILLLNYLSGLAFLLSLFIGFVAIIDMKITNLNISPKLKKNHQLRTHGIYAYIAHPMYTSVLLLCLGLVINNPVIINIITYVILIITLIFKSKLEEKYLNKRFESYAHYRQNIGRFLPKIW